MESTPRINTKIWNDMDLRQVIIVLEQHNKWRRDNNFPPKTKQVDPIILGRAIDIAVEELKQPLEERANAWVSVEDELPPLATDVFVLVDGVVYKAFYNSDDGCFWNDEGFSFYRDVEKWTIIKQQ